MPRLTQALLSSAGIRVEICATFDALVRELQQRRRGDPASRRGVSACHTTAMLREVLDAQPPWSDLPVLVLTRPGADSAESGEAVRTLGNVTLLERPVRVATLLSAVRTAMRARERQYQIRGYLAERARAEESLQLADQRKDEFLATLGHELRNPLAPLLTGAAAAQDDRPQDPVVVRRERGHGASDQPPHRLVDDLLEVSRITRGVIDVQREPLDLGVHRAVGNRHQPTGCRGRRARADGRYPDRADHGVGRCRAPDPGVREPR